MTESLQTLLQHTERQRDEALAAVLRAESTAQRLQQQTEQLLAYRDDYRRQAPASGGRSASIELLRCHQGFMQRLDQALDQQRGQTAQAGQQVARLRAALMALDMRVAAVRKLLQRRAAVARQADARHEQRRTDEAAMRAHRRGTADVPTLS